MKATNLLMFFLLVLSLLLVPGRSEDAAACGIVPEALASFERIKLGVKRRDVEGSFELDGGIQGAPHSRYVFRKCKYIKFEAQFSVAWTNADGRALMSPDDVVTGLSGLYIYYPMKD